MGRITKEKPAPLCKHAVFYAMLLDNIAAQGAQVINQGLKSVLLCTVFRHDDCLIFRAQELRPGRWLLGGVKRSHKIKLIVNDKGGGQAVQLQPEGLSFAPGMQHPGGIIGERGDADRDFQVKGRQSVLHQVKAQDGATSLLVDFNLFNSQLWDVGSIEPLLEKSLQILSGASRKGVFNIVPAGLFVAHGLVQLPYSFQEGLRSDTVAYHVEDHGRFVIPHSADCFRLQLMIISACKRLHRKGVCCMDIRIVAYQQGMTVGRALFAGDCRAMVGEIGCQPFAPVATCVAHPDTVAKPAVDYLMDQRGVRNKRKAHDLLPQQGEGRESVARGQPVLNDGEAAKRERANQLFELLNRLR